MQSNKVEIKTWKLCCVYIVILLYFILFLPALSETIYPPAEPVIRYLQEITNNEDSYLYDAVNTGVFLTNDEWRFGIVSKDRNIVISILLSGHDNDATVLSGQIMVKRNPVNDNSFEICCEVEEYIMEALNSACRQNGMPVLSRFSDIARFNLPFSCHYSARRFVILDEQQKTDIYGNNQEMKRYCIKQAREGNNSYTVREFLEEFFPDILYDDLKNYRLIRYDEETLQVMIAGLNYSEEEIDLLRTALQNEENKKPAYVFPYLNNLFVEVNCNPETEEIFEWCIYSSEMGYEELMRTYLQFFWEVSDTLLPAETIDVLICKDGEEFTWGDAISNVNYPPYVWNRVAYVSDTKWYAWISTDQMNHVPGLRFGFVESMDEVEYNAWGRIQSQ